MMYLGLISYLGPVGLLCVYPQSQKLARLTTNSRAALLGANAHAKR